MTHDTHPEHQVEPFQAGATSPRGAPDTAVIPIVEESATVRTVREHTGTVRLRKRVHTDVHPPAEGFQERVEVVRVPVGRVVETVEAARQEGDTLVLPVYEERWIKQIVLTEELRVTLHREASRPGAGVNLMREEVVVERLDPETGQWRAAPL